MTTLTLTTRKELRFVIGLHIDRPLREVQREVIALAADTKVGVEHVILEFRDPLDALLGWRHLDRTFKPDTSLMSAIASPAAIEMLRDPSELAREAFAALIRPVDDEVVIKKGLFIVGGNLRPVLPEVAASPGGLVLAVIWNDRVRIQELTQPGWVGRLKDAPICIPDGNISKRHVELGVDSHEGWFVRDAKSTSGWYLAGRRAGEKRYTLHTGMVLQLGSALLVVLS